LQLVEEELLEVLGDFPAVLAGSEPYTPKVLAAHPKLKVIARVGVGYDAVNLPAATALSLLRLRHARSRARESRVYRRVRRISG